MLSVMEALSNLGTQPELQFRNLTMLPLMSPRDPAREPDYLLLEDAIASGVVQISELNVGGSVPELRLANKSNLPVLLIDGEELIGAKQNRVLNLTLLASPNCVIVIPVTCVEAGRWRMEEPFFGTANHMMYSNARAERLSQVTRSMHSSGSRASDQTSLWRNIAAKSLQMNAPCPTGAMFGIFEQHSASLEAFVRAFPEQPAQVGAAFAIGNHFVGVDIFDHPNTMSRLLPKLVRSYALDALDQTQAPDTSPIEDSWTWFVAEIGRGQLFTDSALGLGKDVRFTSNRVSGAALWAQEHYVHICAFRHLDAPKTGLLKTNFTRASHRGLF